MRTATPLGDYSFAGAHEASGRRELPLRTTSRSRRTRGRYGIIPDSKSFNISATPTDRGRRRRSPGLIPPRKVWKPQHQWLVATWLRLTESARGENCPSSQRGRPAALRIRFFLRMRTAFIPLQIQQPGDEKRDRPGRYRP